MHLELPNLPPSQNAVEKTRPVAAQSERNLQGDAGSAGIPLSDFPSMWNLSNHVIGGPGYVGRREVWLATGSQLSREEKHELGASAIWNQII